MKKDLVRVKFRNTLADIWYSEDTKMYCGEFVNLPYKATFQSDTMQHCYRLFCELAEEYEVEEIKKILAKQKEEVQRRIRDNDNSETTGE